MIIDSVDVSTFGVRVGDRSPSRSAAVTRLVTVSAPGAWRRQALGHDAPDALMLTVDGHIDGSSLSELQSRIDKFKWTLRPRHELVLSWSDTSGRQWYGYRRDLYIDDIQPGWLQKAVAFRVAIVCPDPRARETNQQQSSSPGTPPRTITPSIGTAPMPVEITIVGGTTLVNPVLHYRNKSDTDIVTLSYAGSVSSSETLVIDTEKFTAKKNGSSVGAYISGSYFQVDPEDGDYLGSPGAPDIRLTADSGTAGTYTVKWYRRYW